MSNNRALRFLASALLAVWSWPAAAGAVTVGAVIANAPSAATTSPTVTTTGNVPANGLLVVAGSYSSTASPPNALTHCGTWIAGADNNNGGRRSTIYYCHADSSGITTPSIVLNQASAGVIGVCAVAYPATVTTHDLSGGNNGSGTSVTWPTSATPTNASEVVVSSVNWNNIGNLTEDASFTPLCGNQGSGGVGWDLGERVITSAAPISYTGSLSSTSTWAASYDSFVYSTGGGSTPHTRMLMGVGQ